MIQLIPKVNIAFNAERHEYHIDGTLVPGVTTILKRSGVRPEWECDQYYLDRGTYIHMAIVLYLEGNLDLASLTPGIKWYVESFMKWWEQNKAYFEIVALEYDCGSKIHMYAGKPDAVFRSRKTGRVWIYDWKSGAAVKSDVLQVSGYAIAWEETYRMKVCGVADLYLQADGSEPKPARICIDKAPRTHFLALLNGLNAREIYRPTKEDN